MTALLEKVLAQARQLPDEAQDTLARQLQQMLIPLAPQQAPAENHKPRPQFGSARGLSYMTADFKEPLEEFRQHSKRIHDQSPRPQFGSAQGMFTLLPEFDESVADFNG